MTHLAAPVHGSKGTRTTGHRAMAVTAVLVVLLDLGLAAWSTLATVEASRAAGPDTDTSLYGLGYVVAAVLAVHAAAVAAIAGGSWYAAGRSAVAGYVGLSVALAVALLPWLGFAPAALGF